MRYPVGFRATWREAIDAAFDSVRLTGLRYMVFRAYHELPDGEVWTFLPKDTPARDRHMPVRI